MECAGVFEVPDGVLPYHAGFCAAMTAEKMRSPRPTTMPSLASVGITSPCVCCEGYRAMIVAQCEIESPQPRHCRQTQGRTFGLFVTVGSEVTRLRANGRLIGRAA